MSGLEGQKICGLSEDQYLSLEYKDEKLADLLQDQNVSCTNSQMLKIISQMLSGNIFPYLTSISKSLPDIASDDDEFAGMLARIIAKTRQDMAHGVLVEALLAIGNTKPDAALGIAKRLLSTNDAHDHALYLIAGSATGDMKKTELLISEMLRSNSLLKQKEALACIGLVYREVGSISDDMLEKLDGFENNDSEKIITGLFEAYMYLVGSDQGKYLGYIKQYVKKYDKCKSMVAPNMWRLNIPESDAMEILQECLKAGDSKTKKYVLEACANVMRSEYKQAVGIIQACIDKDRYDSALLGPIFTEMGKHNAQSAFDCILKIISDDPSGAMARHSREIVADLISESDSVIEFNLENHSTGNPKLTRTYVGMLLRLVAKYSASSPRTALKLRRIMRDLAEKAG